MAEKKNREPFNSSLFMSCPLVTLIRNCTVLVGVLERPSSKEKQLKSASFANISSLMPWLSNETLPIKKGECFVLVKKEVETLKNCEYYMGTLVTLSLVLTVLKDLCPKKISVVIFFHSLDQTKYSQVGEVIQTGIYKLVLLKLKCPLAFSNCYGIYPISIGPIDWDSLIFKGSPQVAFNILVFDFHNGNLVKDPVNEKECINIINKNCSDAIYEVQVLHRLVNNYKCPSFNLQQLGQPLFSYDDYGFPFLVGICVEISPPIKNAVMQKFMNISDVITCLEDKIENDLNSELQQYGLDTNVVAFSKT